jgi:bacterioferritin-associated ferredoxin
VVFACICHAVSDRQVVDAVDSGATTVEAIGNATGAGTGCGTCHDTLQELIGARCGSCPLVVTADAPGLRVA